MGLTHRPQVDPAKLAALYAAAGMDDPEAKAGPRHQPGATRNLPDAALTAPARRRADERAADPRAAGRGDRAAGVGARSAAAAAGGHGPAVAAPAVVPMPPMGPAKAITEAQAPQTNPTTGAVRVEFRTGNHGKGEALYRDGSKFDGDGWHDGAPWAPPSLTAGPASSTGSDAKNAAEALADARSRGTLEPGDVPEQGVNGARLLGFHTDPKRPGGGYAAYDDGSTFDTGGWHAPGVQVPSPDGADDAQAPAPTATAKKETGMDPLDALGDTAAGLIDGTVPALAVADLEDLNLDGLGDEVKYDTSPVGKPGGRQNWVDQEGGLPPFVRAIAHALIRDGKSKQQAIQIAWGQVRNWARGGGDVTAATRAKAAAAVAQLERMRSSAKARPNKGLDDALDLEQKGGWENGAQGAPTGISYKEVPVESVVDVDEDKGIVTAIVSVTGLRDRVGDVIKPGAYSKTLQARKPKGVWSHSWEQPISKTLEIRELLPGDPQLPKQIRGGEPWPREAGALLVKTQFNLLGDRGRQAFADVVFFAEDQEWSIGYNVPAGGAKHEAKAGLPTRYINELDLYEYSPVLFGAMPAAATVSVKSAQHAFKSAMAALHGDELSRFQSLRDDLEVKAGFSEAQVARDRRGRFADKPGGGAGSRWDDTPGERGQEAFRAASRPAVNKPPAYRVKGTAADVEKGDDVSFYDFNTDRQVEGEVTSMSAKRKLFGDDGPEVYDVEVDGEPHLLMADQDVNIKNPDFEREQAEWRRREGKAFSEAQVNRDRRGRFADSPGGPGESSSGRTGFAADTAGFDDRPSGGPYGYTPPKASAPAAPTVKYGGQDVTGMSRPGQIGSGPVEGVDTDGTPIAGDLREERSIYGSTWQVTGPDGTKQRISEEARLRRVPKAPAAASPMRGGSTSPYGSWGSPDDWGGPGRGGQTDLSGQKAFDPQAGAVPDRPAGELVVGDEVTFTRPGDAGPEQVSGVVTAAPERRGADGRAVDLEVDDDPVSLLATEPVRVTGHVDIGTEEKAARRGGAPSGGWQPCGACGSTNRDVFTDGSARCEDCGEPLVHATAGGAKALLIELAEQLGLTADSEVKALLDGAGGGYVDDDAVGYALTSPIEVKAEAPARLSELEVLMARRAALSAD